MHTVRWQTTSQKVTTEATCPMVAAGSGADAVGGPSAGVIRGQGGRAQQAEGHPRFVPVPPAPSAQPGRDRGASFQAPSQALCVGRSALC